MDRKTGIVRKDEIKMKKNSNKKWYLISYDVRDSKRLYRVAKCLGGYGNRIQYSIFRCYLGKRHLERMKWELTKIMEKEDALLIVGLCNSCASRVKSVGCEIEWSTENKTFEIV
jgi:CRISPR-associated protein Cas2